jgi:Thiamine pyrophosphokinase
MSRALLFVNGEPPKKLPTHLANYHYIACTDGAYHSYLSESAIEPDFIIGDLDSINPKMTVPDKTQIIHTPDQSKPDFEKALLFLNSKVYFSTINYFDGSNYVQSTTICQW